MRAYNAWDASRTRARVTILGDLPADSALELLTAEIADGVTPIFVPLTLIVTHADGRVERIAIHDAHERDEEGAP